MALVLIIPILYAKHTVDEVARDVSHALHPVGNDSIRHSIPAVVENIADTGNEGLKMVRICSV